MMLNNNIARKPPPLLCAHVRRKRQENQPTLRKIKSCISALAALLWNDAHRKYPRHDGEIPALFAFD